MSARRKGAQSSRRLHGGRRPPLSDGSPFAPNSDHWLLFSPHAVPQLLIAKSIHLACLDEFDEASASLEVRSSTGAEQI